MKPSTKKFLELCETMRKAQIEIYVKADRLLSEYLDRGKDYDLNDIDKLLRLIRNHMGLIGWDEPILMKYLEEALGWIWYEDREKIKDAFDRVKDVFAQAYDTRE